MCSCCHTVGRRLTVGVSFTGSAVAFGKLHGMLASAPLNLPGKNVANLSMAAGSLAAGATLLTTGDPATGLVLILHLVVPHLQCPTDHARTSTVLCQLARASAVIRSSSNSLSNIRLRWWRPRRWVAVWART